MGIRYFALPVPPQLVNIASTNPRAFLSGRHFWESWSDPPDQPAGLFLDKSWWDMQQLLCGRENEPPRAAYELVRGAVTQYGYGWIPFDRVLSAKKVAAVAKDLAAVDLSELYQAHSHSFSPDWAAIMEGRRDYIERYLSDAKKFTAQLAGQGLGLIYSIG
ncbi:hypothetical protein B5P43_14430 [Bacillus sp. SRB_336]|nr:hypothetical protein B5P43_14430 [Bacillus sp. SRB_336]